jgi:hypothetical protein
LRGGAMISGGTARRHARLDRKPCSLLPFRWGCSSIPVAARRGRRQRPVLQAGTVARWPGRHRLGRWAGGGRRRHPIRFCRATGFFERPAAASQPETPMTINKNTLKTIY